MTSQLPSHIKPVANVHLGIRGIFAGLVERAAIELRKQMQICGTTLIDKVEFRRDIRSTLLALAANPDADVTYLHYQHLPYVPLDASTIAVSNHGALEDPARAASEPGFYAARLSPILDGLDEFFEGAELRLHVAIKCQHDYGPVIDSDDRLNYAASWASMAEKILEKTSSAKLIVWTVEKPIETAVPFITDILGINKADLVEKERDAILNIARRMKFAHPKKPLGTHDQNLSDYLDELYESDLARLGSMRRVELNDRF